MFKGLNGALQFYRTLAFATGVVLVCGTITLIIQWAGAESMKDDFGWLWVVHGYLYIVYLVATLNLGIKMRWDLRRSVLIALAGTVPTMSFVAEHFVTRGVRERMAALVS